MGRWPGLHETLSQTSFPTKEKEEDEHGFLQEQKQEDSTVGSEIRALS